ncbi:MAG: O-antigen ligase family protein [bacterium]|nr:O-antigen ligase family protein [bacterium]
MVNGIFVFLLFALPFVVIFAGISPFETYKVIAAEVLIEILLFFKLIYPKKFQFNKFNKQQIVLISLLIGLIIIDFIFLPNSNNFFGNPFRLQGILLLLHLLIFSLLSSLVEIKIPKFIPIIALSLLFATTLFLGQNSNSRFYGVLGEPNALAATAVFLLPFILFRQKLVFKLVGLLITLIIIYLSGSRSGLIALIIQMSFILISFKSKISLSKSFFVCLILLGLSFFLPFFEKHTGLYENRSLVWQTAFSAGLKSPLIGWGFGNIESGIRKTALELNNAVRVEYVDSSHNFILDYFVQGGTIGLGILGTILFLSTKGLIRNSKKMELVILLGLITAMSFNPASVVILIGFWWVLGQGFYQNQK